MAFLSIASTFTFAKERNPVDIGPALNRIRYRAVLPGTNIPHGLGKIAEMPCGMGGGSPRFPFWVWLEFQP